MPPESKGKDVAYKTTPERLAAIETHLEGIKGKLDAMPCSAVAQTIIRIDKGLSRNTSSLKRLWGLVVAVPSIVLVILAIMRWK